MFLPHFGLDSISDGAVSLLSDVEPSPGRPPNHPFAVVRASFFLGRSVGVRRRLFGDEAMKCQTTVRGIKCQNEARWWLKHYCSTEENRIAVCECCCLLWKKCEFGSVVILGRCDEPATSVLVEDELEVFAHHLDLTKMIRVEAIQPIMHRAAAEIRRLRAEVTGQHGTLHR